MTRTQLENAIVAWIASAYPGSRQVIAWPGAPRPALPYFSVKLLAIESVGHDDKMAIDDDGDQTIYGDRYLTASFQAYGSGALDLIRTINNSLSKDSIVSALLAAGLAPRGPEKIDDLTQQLETDAEERAHVDLVFGFVDTITDAPGLIEIVNGSGKVTSESATEFSFTFTAEKED